MDETQISITVRPIYIERLIYWIVILALAVLLIIAWTGDKSCDTNATGKVTQPAQTAPAVTPPAPTPTPTPTVTATCSDAKKNQDETDVDCGGSCTLKCASGKSCSANSDCVSSICTSGLCTNTAPQTLSGKFEVDLTNVAIQKAPHTSSLDNSTYYTIKVTGVSYKITNGLADDLNGMIIKVFVKNKAGTYCLNQQKSGTCDDAYATFSLSRLAAGKAIDEEHEFAADEYTTLMGKYIVADNGYEPTDSSRDQVNVVMFVYDQNGDMIGGKSYSDTYFVNP